MRMDTTSSIFSFLEVVVVVVIRCGCRRSHHHRNGVTLEMSQVDKLSLKGYGATEHFGGVCGLGGIPGG